MKFEDLAKEVQDKIMSRFANWDMDGKEAFYNPKINVMQRRDFEGNYHNYYCTRALFLA